MKTLLAFMLLLTTMPILAKPNLTQEQKLGQRLFSDKNLSLKRNQACSSCHSLKPAHAKTRQSNRVPGFVDPQNVKTGSAVSKGSIRRLTGNLNAPGVAYAGFSPAFHWDDEEGLYVGGLFWNGRADNLAEQASMPMLNPLEMAMPDAKAVVARIKQRKVYRRLFADVYGVDLKQVATPQHPTLEQAQAIDQVFSLAATAISRFEQSERFHKFNSKFDYVMMKQTEFTPQEAQGFELFNGKAQCSACHSSEAVTDENGKVVQPALFTDFSYDNIGLPRNVNIPGNPQPDLGLGGHVGEDGEIGKHRVMSLRNIAITAPYGHNGALATLEQVVHFYNTRDTLGHVADINQPGFAESGWPEPEEPRNLNRTELGNLGLTDAEEASLVAFLQTLTDDYPKWGKDPRVPRGSAMPYDLPALR